VFLDVIIIFEDKLTIILQVQVLEVSRSTLDRQLKYFLILFDLDTLPPGGYLEPAWNKNRRLT